MLAGIPGDRYGRRDSLRILAILYLVSALGCAFSWDWYSLVHFRFIGGLGIGGSSVLGPMYIAEIAPAKVARTAGGLLPVQRRGRHPAGLLLELPDRPERFGAAEWRWELGVAALPAALFFVLLFSIPRSPRWLVKKGRVTEARAVLEAIGEENVGDGAAGDRRTPFDAEQGHARGTAVHAQVSTSRFSSPSPSACSISSPASTPSSIT